MWMLVYMYVMMTGACLSLSLYVSDDDRCLSLSLFVCMC